MCLRKSFLLTTLYLERPGWCHNIDVVMTTRSWMCVGVSASSSRRNGYVARRQDVGHTSWWSRAHLHAPRHRQQVALHKHVHVSVNCCSSSTDVQLLEMEIITTKDAQSWRSEWSSWRGVMRALKWSYTTCGCTAFHDFYSHFRIWKLNEMNTNPPARVNFGLFLDFPVYFPHLFCHFILIIGSRRL